MRILVYCPGGWSHGLNSPERGEGRWAQNFARMLGEAGYDVYAASGGDPNVKEHYGVKLLSEPEAKTLDNVDMLFDSAWWDSKKPLVKATNNFTVVWQLEHRLTSPRLSLNMNIGFPFEFQSDRFLVPRNIWRKKTFALPARYCKEFGKPHFGKNKFVWSSRAPQKPCGQKVISALNDLGKVYGITGTWMNAKSITNHEVDKQIDESIVSEFVNRTPYNEVRSYIDQASIMIPVEGRSSVLDAITLGVAPLIYEGGIAFGPTRTIAEKYGLLIPVHFSVEQIRNVIETLLTKEDIYCAYVSDLQDFFKGHTQEGSHNRFKEMLNRVQNS